MKRDLYEKLVDWKNKSVKKPLLLQGARQVGKTYLLNEFGSKEYEESIYLNFEQEPELNALFQGSLSAKSIIENIELYIGKKINPTNSLIILDEIQESEKAITSLKYFCEQAPDYHVAAAGSLLGVKVGKGTSFPVGKVNFMTLFPISFSEYLTALDEEYILKELQEIKKIEPIPKIVHEKLIKHLKMFMFLGGMPEVVKSYIEHQDISLAREIQNDIMDSYSRDFSKYTDKPNTMKISELWNSIPVQLAKENKKFKYSDIRKNARASMYDSTIEWLSQAGLIFTAFCLNTPKLPLAGYIENNKFKLYLFDTGLLSAKLKLSSDIVIKGHDLFLHYNGAFTENYVATELRKYTNNDLIYWKSKSDAEIDFIVQNNNEIIPIEVKSGTSKNLKSLLSYSSKYNPKLKIRFSPRNFTQSNNFINLPLYSIFLLDNVLKKELD